LKGKVVGLDTMSFIYLFEEHPDYLGKIKPLFEAIERGDTKGITSTVTVTECLIRPFEMADLPLVAKYRTVFKYFPNIEVLPPIYEVAEKAAELRAIYKIRTPDALQMATAIVNRADFFVTNDTKLSRVSEIRVMQIDELN
jgi:predicted nucleic acid-binding protein